MDIDLDLNNQVHLCANYNNRCQEYSLPNVKCYKCASIALPPGNQKCIEIPTTTGSGATGGVETNFGLVLNYN
jgi:hypothetical protein